MLDKKLLNIHGHIPKCQRECGVLNNGAVTGGQHLSYKFMTALTVGGRVNKLIRVTHGGGYLRCGGAHPLAIGILADYLGICIIAHVS